MDFAFAKHRFFERRTQVAPPKGRSRIALINGQIKEKGLAELTLPVADHNLLPRKRIRHMLVSSGNGATHHRRRSGVCTRSMLDFIRACGKTAREGGKPCRPAD